MTYLGWGVCTPSDEIYHHGIQGMKWGDRNGPPYPLRPGARSGAEKKAGSPIADKFADFNKKRKRKAAVKKALKTKKTKAKFENDRKEALRKGTAEDILKFRGHLSNEEMEKAVKRIEWEIKLEDLNRQTKEVGYRETDKMFGKNGFFGKAKDYTSNVAGTLQNVNKIKKALTEGDTGEKKKDKSSDDKDKSVKHSGIKGQKRGVRRYRNYDGTLTPAGKERYQYNERDTGHIFAYNAEEDEVYESVSGVMVPIPHDRPDYEEKKKQARMAAEKYKEFENAMKHTYLGGGIYGVTSDETYLMHYGRKGMKWHKHIFFTEEDKINQIGKPGVLKPQATAPSTLGRSRERNITGTGTGVHIRRTVGRLRNSGTLLRHISNSKRSSTGASLALKINTKIKLSAISSLRKAANKNTSKDSELQRRGKKVSDRKTAYSYDRTETAKRASDAGLRLGSNIKKQLKDPELHRRGKKVSDRKTAYSYDRTGTTKNEEFKRRGMKARSPKTAYSYNRTGSKKNEELKRRSLKAHTPKTGYSHDRDGSDKITGELNRRSNKAAGNKTAYTYSRTGLQKNTEYRRRGMKARDSKKVYSYSRTGLSKRR